MTQVSAGRRGDPAPAGRLAAERWAALLAARPDLAAAVDLQERLLLVTLDAVDRLRATPGRAPDTTLARAAERLEAGIPVFRADPPEPPFDLLSGLLRPFAAALQAGGAGDAALHLVQALDEGRVSAPSWIVASLTRDGAALEGGSVETGLSSALLWLVGDLAVGPWAAHLAAELERAAAASPTLRRSLDDWGRGFCPACGSWPALAAGIGGSLSLRCSLCTFGWRHRPDACVYCGTMGKAVRVGGVRPGMSALACQACGGYLKLVPPEDASLPFPLLSIVDLETSDLDTAAVERGFGKPPLPAIPGACPARPRCPGP